MPQLVPFHYMPQFILNSLPLQYELSSMLIFNSTVFSSMCSVISNLSNPILLCVSISLVSLITLCCTNAESSQALKTDNTLKTDITGKGKGEEFSPVVNVTYVTILAARSGVDLRVLIDLNQSSGERLRQLWPMSSFPTKRVMVNGIMRTGIQLPEVNYRNGRERQRHPEVVNSRVGASMGRIGIWATAPLDPNPWNLRLITKGDPVVQDTFLGLGMTNNSGSTIKAFIRNNT